MSVQTQCITKTKRLKKKRRDCAVQDSNLGRSHDDIVVRSPLGVPALAFGEREY